MKWDKFPQTKQPWYDVSFPSDPLLFCLYLLGFNKWFAVHVIAADFCTGLLPRSRWISSSSKFPWPCPECASLYGTECQIPVTFPVQLAPRTDFVNFSFFHSPWQHNLIDTKDCYHLSSICLSMSVCPSFHPWNIRPLFPPRKHGEYLATGIAVLRGQFIFYLSMTQRGLCVPADSGVTVAGCKILILSIGPCCTRGQADWWKDPCPVLYLTNKCTISTKTSSLFLKQGEQNAKRTEETHRQRVGQDQTWSAS